MTDYDSRHASQIRAVAQVHESIKGICERIGLDVEAAERFSKDNGNFVLPWHGEAHPRALIKNSQDIIKDAPDSGKDASDIQTGIACGNHWDTCTGLMGALAIVDSDWSPAAKRAFIGYFSSHAGRIDIDTRTLTSTPEAIQAMACWLINDICTASALKQTRLTDTQSDLIDLIIRDQIVHVAETAFFMANEKESDSTIEVKSLVEEALLQLPTESFITKDIVSELYPVFQASSNSLSGGARIMNWLDGLDKLYPEPIRSSDLDGEKIVSEASEAMARYRALEDLTEQLKPHLMTQQAWSDPLGAVIEDLKAKHEVIISFRDRNLLTCPKAKEIFLDLIGRYPSMTITFLTNIFVTRKPDDPALQDISAALNTFIETDRPAILTGLTNSENQTLTGQIVDFLRAVTAVVGKNRVKIVTPRQFQDEADPDATPNCVVSSPYDPVTFDKPRIAFYLDKSPPEERALDTFNQSVAKALPPLLVLGSLASCINNSVLPNLAEKKGEQDRHGLNGCRSVDMAEHLSGAKIAGIGTLPEFGERDIEYQRKNLTYLTIRYTNDNKNRPEIDPIDEEELYPEGDLVLPGRN